MGVPISQEPIKVINKLPKTFLHVLQYQFELMNSWMAPLHTSTTQQSHEIVKLKTTLDATLKHYDRLIRRLSNSPVVDDGEENQK